jgi:hypothetical protein
LDNPDEIVLCGLVFLAGVAAWYIPAAARVPVIMIAIMSANVYAFGRFNPLQPAKTIFEVPDSEGFRALRKEAAAFPDGVLVEPRITGAVLNGLGFRSINHALLAPKPSIFHEYFPAMDPGKFNQVFNRYGYVTLSAIAIPDNPAADVISVPIEAFVPVRNSRRVMLGSASSGGCPQPAGGGIRQISEGGNQLTIDGWAPWNAESDTQGIRVFSSRALRLSALATLTRPDIAEQIQDYRFVKSGFRFQVQSQDGKALRPAELVLVAFGTPRGDFRLPCCGCP